MTFWADVSKHIARSSNISFLSAGDAFLHCGINQPADTWRVINVFAAAYVILTHKHLLNESYAEIDMANWHADGEQVRGHGGHQRLLLPLHLSLLCLCMMLKSTGNCLSNCQFWLVTKPLSSRDCPFLSVFRQQRSIHFFERLEEGFWTDCVVLRCCLSPTWGTNSMQLEARVQMKMAPATVL